MFRITNLNRLYYKNQRNTLYKEYILQEPFAFACERLSFHNPTSSQSLNSCYLSGFEARIFLSFYWFYIRNVSGFCSSNPDTLVVLWCVFFRLFVSCLIRCLQHVFNEGGISPGRIVYRNMRHGSHKFPILENWTTAHEWLSLGPTFLGVKQPCTFDAHLLCMLLIQ